MPKWCMNCGTEKFPDIADSVKRNKKGKLVWKTKSQLALKRKKFLVCGGLLEEYNLVRLKTEKPSSLLAGFWLFFEARFLPETRVPGCLAIPSFEGCPFRLS